MEVNRLMHSMLLDFYGDLLTDKQRECFDLHYNEDLSLAEIAEQSGISRQGVWDNIKRAEASLQEIETKTGLIEKFEQTRKGLEQIDADLEKLSALVDGDAAELVDKIRKQTETLRTRG